MTARIGIVVAFTMSAFHAGAADWPRFRGSDGSGISPEKGLPATWSQRDAIAWKTDLPGPGSSSPVFTGDRIYLTCYTGYNVPGSPRGTPEELQRHLLALDRKTGKVIWDRAVKAVLPEQESIRDAHGYATSTPAVDGERVYCFFGKTGVVAFDHDGKQLWTTRVGDRLNGWGSATSPILHGNLVIVNASVESESLIALNKATGAEVWRAKGIRESWSTPLIVMPKDGPPELAVPMAGKIHAYDPATGRLLWTCATDIKWYMVPSLIAYDGVIYSLGGRSGVTGLAVRAGGKGDVTATHRLWTTNKGSNVSSPVFKDGHLYWVVDSTGVAMCVKASTGDVVYEERLPRAGQVYASALLVDDRIHFLTRDGRTFIVAAKPQYELLATNDLRDGSLFHATPVAMDGRLFIRSDKALYCIGK